MDSKDTITEIDLKKSVSNSFLTKKALLIILSSNFFGKTYLLTRQSNLIGRNDSCDLKLNDPKISNEHCVIKLQNDDFYVEDLNSKNFTFINGKKIKKNTKLFYGDKVIIGETILRFFFKENLGSEMK